MKTLMFLLCLISIQDQEAPPILRAGDAVKGVIEKGDPVVHANALDKRQTKTPTVGKQYIIELPMGGTIPSS